MRVGGQEVPLERMKKGRWRRSSYPSTGPSTQPASTKRPRGRRLVGGDPKSEVRRTKRHVSSCTLPTIGLGRIGGPAVRSTRGHMREACVRQLGQRAVPPISEAGRCSWRTTHTSDAAALFRMNLTGLTKHKASATIFKLIATVGGHRLSEGQACSLHFPAGPRSAAPSQAQRKAK